MQGTSKRLKSNLKKTIGRYHLAGDNSGEGSSLSNLGSMQAQTNRLEAAVTSYSAALELLQKAGNRMDESNTLYNLGSAN